MRFVERFGADVACVIFVLALWAPSCPPPPVCVGLDGLPCPSPSPSISPSPSPSPSTTPTPTPTPPPSPSPTPAPTPTPTPEPSPTPPQECVVDPATGNYHKPAEGVCPSCFRDSFAWMGVAFRSAVPVPTNHGIYLGKRYNFDATPHSLKPHCGHVGDRARCEQWPPCQDRRGADFYMTLPGKFTDHRCDLASEDVGGTGYWCHHKPRANETGPTTVCAVPVGDPAGSPRGRCVTVDVR